MQSVKATFLRLWARVKDANPWKDDLDKFLDAAKGEYDPQVVIQAKPVMVQMVEAFAGLLGGPMPQALIRVLYRLACERKINEKTDIADVIIMLIIEIKDEPGLIPDLQKMVLKFEIKTLFKALKMAVRLNAAAPLILVVLCFLAAGGSILLIKKIASMEEGPVDRIKDQIRKLRDGSKGEDTKTFDKAMKDFDVFAGKM